MMKKLNEIPKAPEKLDENGAWYFFTYGQALLDRGSLYEGIIPKLVDLCWWEQQKEKHRGKLEDQDPVHEYYNEDGSIKHTQSSAGLAI